MAKIIPGITVFAVVFPDGAPLAFAEIRSPFFPGNARVARFFKTLLFLAHNDGLLNASDVRGLMLTQFKFHRAVQRPRFCRL